MKDTRTNIIYNTNNDDTGREREAQEGPLLFVCCGHEILEYPLVGRQLMGRSTVEEGADIFIPNRYVSRFHGWFDTKDGKVVYTAQKTSNGIIYGGSFLNPGVSVTLGDGDELIIPTGLHEEGTDILLVCAIESARKGIWRELRKATRDALTGIAGRNGFRTWCAQNKRRLSGESCIFILDIDYFKQINDTYGHSAGDSALRELSKCLLGCVGKQGYVCRWGGDEFVGILSVGIDEAYRRLTGLTVQVSSVKIENLFSITISVGLTRVGAKTGEYDIDDYVSVADQALYEAKTEGRNRVKIV